MRYLKKRGTELLRLKTDSFVAQSNVHFPTDYNLLWDSSRKSLDMVNKLIKKHPNTEGWRNMKDWRRSIKNLSRELGKASSSGGKSKEDKVKTATEEYIRKCKKLINKLEEFEKSNTNLSL